MMNAQFLVLPDALSEKGSQQHDQVLSEQPLQEPYRESSVSKK
jgi:hypothetical protein